MANLNVGNLISTLRMDTKPFSAGVGKAQAQTKSFGASFAASMSKLKVPILAVGAALAGIGIAAFKAADDTQKAYNTIRIGTGATGEALEDLTQQFDDLKGVVVGTNDEIAGALTALNTLTGATGDELEELTGKVLDVSRMLGEDAVGNSEAFGKSLKQWGVPAEEGTELLDGMFKITQDTGIGFSGLTSDLTVYGSVLKNAGFDIKEASDLFGDLSSAGISTSRIMPGLNAAFRNWAKEGKNSRDELEKVVNSMKDAEDEAEALTIATDTFGAEGAQRLTTAIRADIFDLEDLGESFVDTEGLISDTVDETMTIGDRFGLLAARIEEKLVPVGDVIIGALMGAFDWWDANGAEQMAPLYESFDKIKQWWDENGAIIIAKVQDFYKYLIDSFRPLTEMYSSFWGDEANIAVEWWDENGPLIMEAANVVAEALKITFEGLMIVWDFVWDHLEDVLGGAVDTILGIVKLFAALITGDWETAGDALIDITEGIMEMMLGVVGLGFDAVAIGIETVMNGISQFITDVWAGIVKTFETSINRVIDMINSMIDGVNAISGKIGISFAKIEKVDFGTEDYTAKQYEIPRFADTGIKEGLMGAMEEKRAPMAALLGGSETSKVEQTVIINAPTELDPGAVGKATRSASRQALMESKGVTI